MPVPPEQLDEIAATVAEVYREAETALVRIIARHLAGDLDGDMQAPAWAEKKLAAVSALRRSARAVVTGLQAAGEGAARDAAVAAFRAGWNGALAELPAEWYPQSGLGAAAAAAAEEVPGFAAVEALAAAVHADIGEKARNILRDVVDVYRKVITGAVARTVTGVQTRREAAQAAWKAFTDRGITGFVDRSGRRWQLSSYVEMATRTVTQRAAVQGQTDRLTAAGINLLIVSDAPQECSLCRPFEGEVLTLAGPTGDVQVPHQLTDEPITVHVKATLAEAQLLGLFHPNCRHSVSAYLPGVTRRPTRPTADPDGDRARQQQRAIERKIRREKLAQQGALDEPARKAAGARVRAAQAQMRAHLDEHPQLKRLSYREQIGAGNLASGRSTDAAGGIGLAEQTTLDGRSEPVRRAPRVDQPAEPDRPEVDDQQLTLDEPDAPVRDVTALSDDDLDGLMAQAAADGDEQLLDAVLAELDRRQAAVPDEPAVDDGEHAAEWAEFDRLTAEGVDEREAYAQAFDLDPDRVRRDDAINRLRADGYHGAGFDELARAAYRDTVQQAYLAAEAATNGFLLTAEGQRRGLDPIELWRQNEAYARRWASDELKAWWDIHGRITFDQYKAEQLSGHSGQRFRTGGESWLQ